METKHTPGVWEIEKRNLDLEIDIKSSNGKRICQVKAFQGASFNDPTIEEAKINAKLIAAAPELLEALEAINARINGDFDNPALIKFGTLSTNTNQDIYLITNNAIKKATK